MTINKLQKVSLEAGNKEGLPDAKPRPRTDHHESADDYCGVIHDLGCYRIAVCKDDLQWLFQRRRPRFKGVGTAWDSLSFITTRTALIRVQREYMGYDAPVLLTLPELFKSGGQQ